MNLTQNIQHGISERIPKLAAAVRSYIQAVYLDIFGLKHAPALRSIYSVSFDVQVACT